MTPAATDWEAIELACRAGVLSVRGIAKQHGVTHGAINKRARVHKWSRDLSAKVRKAVSTQLVSTEVSMTAPATERAAVEAAAAQVVSLVREHRKGIQGQRSLAELLKAQLEEAIGNRELIEMAIDEECQVAEDAPGYVKAQAEQKRKAMLKAQHLEHSAPTWGTRLQSAIHRPFGTPFVPYPRIDAQPR